MMIRPSAYCHTICYHTLRSAYMQAVKWPLCLRSYDLAETKIDAECKLHYLFTFYMC
jgi:hypothetical protein